MNSDAKNETQQRIEKSNEATQKILRILDNFDYFETIWILANVNGVCEEKAFADVEKIPYEERLKAYVQYWKEHPYE